MKSLKINTLVPFIIIFFFLMGCGSSKVAYSTEAIAAIKEQVQDKQFEVISQWAYPSPSNALNSLGNAGLFPQGDNPNQVSLIGNPNYLKIEGDSIKAQLPYYGERQLGGSYNPRNVGILLDGLVEDVRVDFDDSKKKYTMSFDANQGTENYQITLDIFPNKQVYMNINSSQRRNIAYRGAIKALEQEN